MTRGCRVVFMSPRRHALACKLAIWSFEVHCKPHDLLVDLCRESPTLSSERLTLDEHLNIQLGTLAMTDRTLDICAADLLRCRRGLSLARDAYSPKQHFSPLRHP